MIRVAEVPIDVDLSRFSLWLQSHGVQHRISEEQGILCLFLENESLIPQVKTALDQYLQEPETHLRLDQWVDSYQRRKFRPTGYLNQTLYLRATPSQAPILFILMALSLAVALISDFGQGGAFLRFFLILDPFSLNMNLNSAGERWDALMLVLSRGELWRVISPDFIHFNAMHITFNLLMLWVLGGQLEADKGSLSFLALIVFVSIISNIAQLLETNYLFGGMSGVVYGLVGYCWLWRYYRPSIFFPDALLKFSLVWLIMGYTPLTEWLGLGKMANAAHLYGLIAGLIWGGITLFVNEQRGRN